MFVHGPIFNFKESKDILNCTLRFLIGGKNSPLSPFTRFGQFSLLCDWSRRLVPKIFSQSNTEPKTIATLSPAFSRASGGFLIFFSSDRLLVSLFFIHRDFFGFGCTIFAHADCIFSTFLFFILFSRTIPILPKGTSYQSLSKVQLRPHSLLTTIFFFTCTIVTILLRVLTSRVYACSDFWCHRNTSVKHKAWARKVHFSVNRALISRAKLQGKHKEKRLSRQICTKNKTSIRSCQSVKGKLENLLPQTLFEYEFPADVPLCSEFYQKSYAVFKHRDLSARVFVPKGT